MEGLAPHEPRASTGAVTMLAPCCDDCSATRVLGLHGAPAAMPIPADMIGAVGCNTVVHAGGSSAAVRHGTEHNSVHAA